MKRARILVVEDERITARDIQATLQSLGHDVPAISASGEDALEKVEALRPDLVLLDIRLQGTMDGVTVAEEVRRRHRVPVIYLTANADAETLERAARSEAYGYLLKPFSEQELHTTVQLALFKAEAERVLAEREAWFRKLVEKSSEIILVLDPDATVRFASPPVERVLGFCPSNVVGRNAMEMVHSDDRAGMEQAFVRVLADAGECATMEYRSRHHDGGWRVFEAQASNYLADPVIRGIVVNTRDITERKQAEDVVEAARVAAERASKAKTELLSRTSHELRTPLNAILGFGQLLEMSELPAEDAESVEQILAAGRHLLAMVEEVLDLSAVEAGRVPLELSAVSVPEVLRRSLDLVRPLATQQRISIDPGASLDAPLAVWADARRVQQVMLNLLSNAIRYNRENGSVTVSCEETPESRIRISVRDTGPGIAPEDLARLFIPFERLDAEQRGVKGTGLGLALSRGLVESMHGLMGVESVPGEGSTFRVELPRAEISPAAERAESAASQADGPRPTVLYIEDNPANVRLVERILSRRPGARIVVASDGAEGLRITRRQRPRLILLDLMLPGLSGEAVLRQLQEDASTREIPVVVVSANAHAEQVRHLLALGASAYLTKPLDVAEFMAVVEQHLGGAEPGTAA